MLTIFTKMLTIALLLAIGALVYKLGIIGKASSKELSALIVQLCNPMLVITNALADPDALTPATLGLSLVVVLVIYLVLIGLGHLLPRLLGAPKQAYPSYLMLTLFGNSAFIGIPVTLSILGSSAMPFVIVYNVVYNLFFYLYGEQVVSKAAGKQAAFSPKKLVNSGTVACAIAISVYLLHLSLPEWLGQGLGYISSATTFLSMLVLGITLATSPLRQVLGNVRCYLFSALRILVFPILLALVLRLVFPDSPMMVSALVLMAAMPAANTPVMMAAQYDMNTDTLTSGILISTLMCLVTIPLVSGFFPV